MDQVRWFVYWTVFIPLALGVAIFGAITLVMVGALFTWEWCFEEASSEEIREHPLRSQEASR